ncbi:MAG: glycosyltransferase [Lachnospiraceae bacterium]|nr:glycosyltransferase [Lachnospiraceae bacterium]
MVFTVITVSFRAGEKLKNTIADVLTQEYSDYEILIKDGLSTDDSIKLLMEELEGRGYRNTSGNEAEEFCYEKVEAPRIRIISRKDKGIYDAMNQAVDLASGDYVIFMNCGDRFYDTQVLKNTAEVIAQNPQKGIYYGDAYFCQAKEIISQPKEITEFVCYRHMPNHQACFFDRHLWDGKGFDLDFKIRADYEFFLRSYFEKGIRPCYLGICVSSYEGGGYSESKENRKRDREEHRKIVVRYMGEKKANHYRRIMIFTLQPLRTWIAQKSIFAGAYNSLKKKLYR